MAERQEKKTVMNVWRSWMYHHHKNKFMFVMERLETKHLANIFSLCHIFSWTAKAPLLALLWHSWISAMATLGCVASASSSQCSSSVGLMSRLWSTYAATTRVSTLLLFWKTLHLENANSLLHWHAGSGKPVIEHGLSSGQVLSRVGTHEIGLQRKCRISHHGVGQFSQMLCTREKFILEHIQGLLPPVLQWICNLYWEGLETPLRISSCNSWNNFWMWMGLWC